METKEIIYELRTKNGKLFLSIVRRIPFLEPRCKYSHYNRHYIVYYRNIRGSRRTHKEKCPYAREYVKYSPCKSKYAVCKHEKRIFKGFFTIVAFH